MNQISRTIYVPIVMITLLLGGCASSDIQGRQFGGSDMQVAPADVEQHSAAQLGTMSARASTPTNPVIAAVRIEPVFKDLDQRMEAEAEIESLAGEIEAEAESRQATIEQLKSKLEDLTDSTQREAFNDEIILETLKLRYWYEQSTAELEVEKALRLEELYISVKKAIKDLADAEGYDIVILDDSMEDPQFDRKSRVPAQVQILQQIASHKILYLNQAIDITDDLITRMNNEFRAAQSGP